MKHLSWLYILLILAGCTESSVENFPLTGKDEFYATIEGEGSRTYVDNQIRMRWHAEDRITVFKKETYNREFMFTGKTGSNSGGFTQVSVDDEFYSGYDVDANYAVYPYSADTQLDETDCFFTLAIPAEQAYAENSFGLNANTMVAVSETGNLMFKNVGCYLRVRLHGENVAVSSITLTSKGTEAIAGEAKVTPSINGDPTCEMIGTGETISLVCDEPVTISSDENNPTDFWIVVPPVTLASGFSVTVENDNGDKQVYDVDQPFTFVRNKYYDMDREVVFEAEIDAVDLGLSVMWAKCNIGATQPEEYGDFYAWGETETKESYTWENYSYYNSKNDAWVNLGDSISGTSVDVAHQKLGKGWRMPTKDEMGELLDNCQATHTKVNGVSGVLFTASNGNSIFLPKAGFWIDGMFTDEGLSMRYWTATQYVGAEYSAWAMGYDGIDHASPFFNNIIIGAGYIACRPDGCNIRPVYDK